MEALRQAKKSNQDGRWRIKADACDVRSGLRESMLGEWAGDKDLGSGALQLLYKEYRSRCLYVCQLGLIAQDFVQLKSKLENDMVFLLEGEKVAKRGICQGYRHFGQKENQP